MKEPIRVAIAQINPLVGDVLGNTKKIIDYAIKARDQLHARAVIFPEMALSGYPLYDLLLNNNIHVQIKNALKEIKNTVKNIYIIIGYPEQDKAKRYNSAIVIYNGEFIANYRKQNLDSIEDQYFTPGNKVCVFKIHSHKMALFICKDLWTTKPKPSFKKNQLDAIICINASPFTITKAALREKLLNQKARELKAPIIYANCVGGQDDFIFDGESMLVNRQGKIIKRAGFFNEELLLTELSSISSRPRKINFKHNIESLIYQALVLSVRDYVEKNHFKGVVIGSSGGIDSALTIAIAVDALGKDRVATVFMPSCHTSDLSAEIVSSQSKILKIKNYTIPINNIFNCYINSLKDIFKELPEDITEENLQARCRGTLLMAISNKKKLLVLATGNKSELAMGYATLYGDMAGGFCPLADLTKTLVYRLANYRNSISLVISEDAITREPSAELRPNQKDTDSLPPYAILDEIIVKYIEQGQSVEKIIAAGFEAATVKKVIATIELNEYKRRQAPIGPKITSGKDRKSPITKAIFQDIKYQK